MEASSAERRGDYLDFSRLSPGEYLGMGAAVVLFGSLWLPWFTTSADNPNSRLSGASGGDSASAWQVFSTLDWLLVLACLAPFILSWIVARGHKLTWKPGEVTMVVGITAFVLILCNGIILGRPGDSVDIGLGIGYFVALIASAGMLVAGYLRQAFYTDRAQAARRHIASGSWGSSPDRNLAMELVRTTEYAALACARWIGRGDKEGADGAAVDAMRLLLDTVSMDGVVVIGEGEKDEAPMLYNGEHIGDGTAPEVDIAVDPLEGTELCAKGLPNAIATIALSERGTMFDPGPCVYMLKMATSRDMAAPARPRPAARRDARADGQGEGRVGRRPRGDHARPPAPRRGDGGDPRGRRAHPADPARRRLGGARGGDRGLARRPALRHRRHPRGRAGRGRDQVHRRPDPRAGCGRARTRSATPRSRPATTSTRCSTATGWCRARTSSSPPPA